MRTSALRVCVMGLSCVLLTQCGLISSSGVKMGGPTSAERNAAIASESTGDFYYGRRYYVEKTRFWGYVRKPRQSWKQAQLVMIREDQKRVPDRLPEDGPAGARYGYDQNYEYRIWGDYTGRKVYEPNSNQILPEFRLTNYELVNRDPGWLFSPQDRYHSKRVSLIPR